MHRTIIIHTIKTFAGLRLVSIQGDAFPELLFRLASIL
jgi:hypothetical protein